MIYETLLQEADKENIEIVHRQFRGRIKGLYSGQVIALNTNLKKTVEKTCILAEELGHYHTTAGNILDQKQLQNRKQERIARAWGYKRLVPLSKLVEAYKSGVKNRFELAEYLHVTEPFLTSAVQYYKEKYGFFHREGDFLICFEHLQL